MTNNELSIRLLPGGLFISGTSVEITPGPEIISQIKEAILTYLEQNPSLPEQIICEVCTDRITLIPAEEHDNADAMFHFVLPDLDREEKILCSAMTIDKEILSSTKVIDKEIQNSAMTTNEITVQHDTPLLLYSIDAELFHFLERNLPQVTFTHPMIRLNSIFCQRSRQFSRPVLFAHADETSMSLLLYANQRLQLAMRYDTASAANRAYYLLNTWKQMQLDQQLDHLLLIGHPAQINQLRARVAQYIKRTEMMLISEDAIEQIKKV